ncbi:hypothetical protein C0Q70_04207 [Pomacea canaliculata]|uniref:Uncharacterized protein n=1 Tax=Pomacea canaliculata TaxID=400727 RepID=A0A2T7PUW4_POMCA|nr:hypothetical protein C0Q70_04207 [Pomacea canaliculata]
MEERRICSQFSAALSNSSSHHTSALMEFVQPSTTSYIHRISADGKAVKTIGSVGGRLNDIHIYSEEMGLNDDVHTTTTGVHDVTSGVTNLSGGINANQGDNSLRFLRQRSNEQTVSGTSTTDCPKMDHDAQKAYFSRQSSENIYDEPLIARHRPH